MQKRLITTLFLGAFALSVAAQSAREVLDRAAARLTNSGDVRAQFKATQFKGSTPEGEAAGTMLLSGRKYKMVTDEMTTWYDGTTQWNMMQGSNEVNVSEPTEEEQAAMNPATLIGIYKKGYKYSMKKSTLRGKQTFVVYLKAKNKKAAFSEIYVDVEQGTYAPLCLRAKKDGDWLRLAILSFQSGQSLPTSTFTFPTKDFPNVEVIDLR